MKKRLFAVLLCGLLSVSSAACQKTPENTENGSTSLSVQESDNTDAPSTEQDNQKTDATGMPEESESMNEVLMALAAASHELHTEYGVWNEEYFWTALSFLVSQTGMSSAAAEDHGDTLTMPAEYVKEYANALFAGYDGNTEELPDIPEEYQLVSYDSKEDCYTFTKADCENMELKLDSCVGNGDGTWQIKLSLYTGQENKSSESYSALMQTTSYQGSGKPFFHYMISVFEPADVSGSPDDFAAQGMISQDEALECAEQLYGKSGDADPDTGNIFSYGLEEMTDIDGVTYYNFRVSWLVVDENGQPDHSSYLGNVLVSMDGSMVSEAVRDETGNWEIVE